MLAGRRLSERAPCGGLHRTHSLCAMVQDFSALRYWRNYFEATDGLIWVVDSADTRRLVPLSLMCRHPARIWCMFDSSSCFRLEDCRAELKKLLVQEVLQPLQLHGRGKPSALPILEHTPSPLYFSRSWPARRSSCSQTSRTCRARCQPKRSPR